MRVYITADGTDLESDGWGSTPAFETRALADQRVSSTVVCDMEGVIRAVEVRKLPALAIEAPPSACVCAASTTS